MPKSSLQKPPPSKPYLTSMGMAVPVLSLRFHTYRRTRRRHAGRFHRFGISMVWTSYRRVLE